MKLIILVPCYNEALTLQSSHRQLKECCAALKECHGAEAEILYVDDGSKDDTWRFIEDFSKQDAQGAVRGIKLSANCGHQAALMAGLSWAAEKADCVITIDADLQDDVAVMGQMVEDFKQGKDIVYGVRRKRESDKFAKKYSALVFYWLLQKMGGSIVYNHADFRLMSKRAIKALLQFPERNLFLRGMVCRLGFASSMVYYDRKERVYGESKYPVSKMIGFALDGITSFSNKPLRVIALLGVIFMCMAVLSIIYGLFSYAEGDAYPGWTSLIVSLWFIGGAILLALGIIGEYIGKIYMEVKRRPLYFIEQEI